MCDMRFYIGRQPEALREAIARRAETCLPFAEQWCASGADRLYLVGSGTSGNAARAAAPFLQRVLDAEVTPVSPTSLPALLKGKPSSFSSPRADSPPTRSARSSGWRPGHGSR